MSQLIHTFDPVKEQWHQLQTKILKAEYGEAEYMSWEVKESGEAAKIWKVE